MTTHTLEFLARAVSVDMSAWEVRGRLGQRYRRHVMSLEFIPVRDIVQQGCFQLDEDLREDRGGGGRVRGLVKENQLH